MDYDPKDLGQTALFFLNSANRLKRAHPELFSNVSEQDQAFNTNAIWNAARHAGLALNDDNIEMLIQAGKDSKFLRVSEIPNPIPGSMPVVNPIPVRDENGAIVHQPITETEWARTAPLAMLKAHIDQEASRNKPEAVFQPTSAASITVGEAFELARQNAKAPAQRRQVPELSAWELEKQSEMTADELRQYLDPTARPRESSGF